MKLNKIKIINFGKLSDLSFDLPSPKLNVFFGQNEAGKSTTVAFIKQVMFGFYLKSNSSPFFEDYKPLKKASPMGGSLYFEDEKTGDQYELERLWTKGDKTKRGILTVKKDGAQVPESVFFDKIQNIDGDFYADSFIFNQEMLGKVSGLSQEDLLERIYYLGASNSSQLLQERDNFAKEARKLFKKTGKKPEVNRLLNELAQERDELAQNKDEFDLYKDVQTDYNEQSNRLNKAQHELSNLTAQKNHWAELNKDLANYQKLQKLQAENQQVAFDSQDYQKAQTLSAQKTNLQKTTSELSLQLKQLDQEDEGQDYSELTQKKSEVLQLQAEDKSYRQKADQIKAEEEQILSLTPEVGRFIEFDDAKLQQLKTDYNKLPDRSEITEPETISNKNTALIIGLIIAVVGLIGIGFLGSISYLILALGLIIIGYGAYRKSIISKKEKAKIDKAQEVKEQYEKFTAKYNVDPDNLDLNNLLLQVSQYKLKLKAEKTTTNELNEINAKLSKIALKLQKALKTPVNSDFSSVLAALDKVSVIETKIQRQNDKKSELEASLQSKQTQLKELDLQLNVILARANVKDMQEYDELYQAYLAHTKLETEIESIESSLGRNLDELAKLGHNSDKLAKDMEELTTKINEKEQEVSSLQQVLAQLQVKLKNLADSDKVFESKQTLAGVEAQFINSSQEYLANLLASRWIARALDIASNERFPKMLKSAKEYFNLLTGGRYTDIILDKKLSVTRQDGKKLEVKYLSRGTGEQLYFALKLAFVEQIKDKINLPILIDDSFVNFDDQRITYIKQLLEKLAQNNQVLIFTAQESLVEKLALQPLTFERKINA